MKTIKMLALPALLLSLYAPLSVANANNAALSAPHVLQAPKIAHEKYTLPNGLEVILVEDKKLPVVTVNIWYHVGPANEEPGLTGFAHLFEHMMFAATKHVPRGMADKLLEAAGVSDSNGTTDFDRTNYFDTVPSNQLELALWLHSDRMGYLLDVLDQTALSNQQDVVRNERRQSVENRPFGIVEEALFHQLFPKEHPYYASVIGSHADIQNAKLNDIRKFFTNYYSPNNASLVIAGDFDKTKIRAQVEKYFGSFKRGPAVAKPKVVTPPITAERRAVVADRVELPRVFMGWLTSSAYTPGDAELALAAQILGGGKSSRLYKSLVYEKQIAQEVSAAQYSYALTSMFVLDVTARPGRSADEMEKAMDAELQRLASEGPTEKEVERARNTLLASLLSTVEKTSGMANQMNHYNQYVGDPGYLSKDIERLQKVDAAAIKAAVQAQLKKEARAVVHGVPGTPDLGPEVPTPPAPKAVKGETVAMNADQAWRAKQPQPGAQPKLILPKAESFTLANGLQVIYHKKSGLPMVAAELVVKAGSSANPVDKPGLADFTSKMLQEGTAKRNSLQIADEVAQLGAALETGSGADSSYARVLALKSNFAQALEILADLGTNPSFPKEEVERLRASRIGELSQEKENARAVANRVSRMAMFGKDNPLAYPQLGTEAALKAINVADVQDFWRKNFVPNNAALVVSGDISGEELKKLVQDHFGAWKQGEVPVRKSYAAQSTDAKLVIVDKPGAPQTALMVVAAGPQRKTDEYESLQVMNAALGGLFTSRVNNNLREQKGYTYGVSSSFAYMRNAGQFNLGGGIRTDVTGPAVSEIYKEIKAMVSKPMSVAELNGARNALVLSMPSVFATNVNISTSLAGLFTYDLGLDYFAGVPQRYAKVSVPSAQQGASKYLSPEKLKVVAVGDKAKILPQLNKLKLGKLEERDAEGNLK